MTAPVTDTVRQYTTCPRSMGLDMPIHFGTKNRLHSANVTTDISEQIVL
jgi:hypothetical protein